MKTSQRQQLILRGTALALLVSAAPLTTGAFAAPVSAVQTVAGEPTPLPASPLPAPPFQDAAPAPQDYTLASQDAISITVINFPQLSVPQVVVPPDGRITVPLLHSVSVKGMTVDQVAAMLTQKWREYVVDPSVTVSLMQKRPQEVLFYGYAAKAGPVDYRPDLRIVEALAEDGGALPTGDLSQVTVTHRDGSKVVLDLSHPETKAGTAVDIPLLPGDTVYIPEDRDEFSVLGHVAHPGSFPYTDNMTALDALTEVGGVTDDADLAGATLVHHGQEQPLNLEALLRQGNMADNVTLSPGDRILVPEIQNRTYVFGAVGRAGYYTFKPGDRVLDALTGSGGPTPNADLGKVNVIHIDHAKNTVSMRKVDIGKFLTKGDSSQNIALNPGDVLFVPDKKQGLNFQDVLGMLSGVGLVGNAVHVLSGGL